jgi:hypothetical protein
MKLSPQLTPWGMFADTAAGFSTVLERKSPEINGRGEALPAVVAITRVRVK